MLFRPGSIVPGRNPPIAVVAGRSRSPQHRLLPLFHRLFHLRPLVRPLLQSSFSAAAIRLFARISSCTLRLTNWAVCNSNCTNSRCTSYWRSNGRSPILRRITFLCEVLGICVRRVSWTRGRIMCLHAMMRFHHRAIHMATFSSSHTAPTGSLRKKIAESEKIRKLGKKRNPKKDDFIVYVPESLAFLDTASLPMVLTAVAVALFAKVLMMYDESRSQEMIERKIKHAPPGQGTVRMLSREEWDEIQDIRPRTPFESKLARPNARLRTGEPLSMEDVKDWTIDVLTDALARAEETVRRGTK